MQALGAGRLWFYEKFWGVFWDYDAPQRRIFRSEAHFIWSSFAQRRTYPKCHKILKARGSESARSLWHTEFWLDFGFTFITIPRFFHLVRLLFVHLLLMPVYIWLDFTFVRAFFTFVLCFAFVFLTARILCLLLWLLSDTFQITSAPHLSQEYDVLSCCLVWWM